MAASSPLASLCQDDIVCLLPGVGHTGPRPFNSGWYRGLRGLAGAVSYTAMLRTWTPLTHHEAPLSMRAAVAALLMCHARKACVLSLVPRDVVFQVLECCHWHGVRDARAPTPGLLGRLTGGGQGLGLFEQQQYEDPGTVGGAMFSGPAEGEGSRRNCHLM